VPVVIGVVVLLASVLAAVVVFRGDDDAVEAQPGALQSSLARATEAEAPFEGLTEIELAVAGECRRVVVADEVTEQASGLRGIPDPGPYSGMLFAYPQPVQNVYTMRGVTFPLELGFYDAAGRPVDRSHLEPCPEADDRCPSYPSRAPYRYTLETYDGDVPTGPIGGCPG
jgi:uncharacterized membrane protein (UPF0127 family)